MMLAGTVAAVGVALLGEQRPQPVFAEVTPQPRPLVAGIGARMGTFSDAREAFTRRLIVLVAVVAGVLALVAAIPAVTAAVSSIGSGSGPAAPIYGPPLTLRSASGVVGDWAQSYRDASPDPQQLGGAIIAGTIEEQNAQLAAALQYVSYQQQQAVAQQRAVAASDAANATSNQVHSLNAASGLAVGTVLQARITIYGCKGPGGGYCNHMAGGGWPFEGAAACSSNLPFGTKLTIDGDPTGRTYECLDRGNLSPTWIDVYFNDTTDGMHWQSLLGSTVSTIHIVN